ncbi:hypothetical protein FRC04_009698 [Tulasnella sp. 424]|nr:hypothetical protein FRC04_009698 [Tulasnella sp. 424]
MLPSPAIVSEQEPDSTDLLIRAITTIIWLLWPKAKEAKPHSKRHPQRLSRLSLLFVPATRASDVAAITAVVGQSCVHVEAVQGSEKPLNGRLDDVKNHIKSTPWNASMLPEPDKLRTELVEDPLRFCFTRGIEAITPVAHGAALQKLLTDMYKLAPTCPEKDSSRDSLRRYIYCFCQKKILQRLQSPIPGYNGRFVGLFLSSKRRGPITMQDFKSRTKRESPRCNNVSEHWLHYRLAMRYKDEDFGSKPTAPQPYRLHLRTENQFWSLWEFFTVCLADLEGALVWLDQNTRGTQADSYAQAAGVLEVVAELMRTLYNFAHASPTFWSLVMEMENVLNDRVDQVGRADESDPGSPAHSDGEDSDDGLETEQVKGDIQLSGIALKVRTWLCRVTQWFGAISDLSKGRLALGALNRQLSIHVDVAPKVVQPERQASLRAVVDSLGGEGTTNDKLELILARARELYQGQKLPESTAAYALVKASMDDEASLEPWERLFPSSSVHCEARLASIMYQKQNLAIGVSKRCCYCCGRLLNKLGFQKDNISDHGKIYAWAPPPQLSDEVKEHILGKLKTRLERYLGDYAAERREADLSGSEAGSCAFDDDDVKVPRLADVLPGLRK